MSEEPQYWQMAKAATKATFPFILWRENLLEAGHVEARTCLSVVARPIIWR